MAAQQPFVALHLGGNGFIGSLVGGILQGNIPRVDGGNQLSFPDPLSFHYRKVDDLSADTKCQFHIFHRFHHAGKVFEYYRL